MISGVPKTAAMTGTSASPPSERDRWRGPSSNVMALRNASSWSGSSCWMYLSPMPIWRRNCSVASTTSTTPQTPYSVVVRNAATRKPRMSASVLTLVRKIALTIVPRAARIRSPVPAPGRPVGRRRRSCRRGRAARRRRLPGSGPRRPAAKAPRAGPRRPAEKAPGAGPRPRAAEAPRRSSTAPAEAADRRQQRRRAAGQAEAAERSAHLARVLALRRRTAPRRRPRRRAAAPAAPRAPGGPTSARRSAAAKRPTPRASAPGPRAARA